ncbi:hypothetical protein C8Q74DRAFT_1370749 [Fomes fomentarius]|nr:hypothetical protein C8Q74DRAFT_1370749 [Fomes fomentarius]
MDLLERGYSVWATVRSESKAGYLRDYFKVFGDKYKLVIVDDNTKDGAFDDVTQDRRAHSAGHDEQSLQHSSEQILRQARLRHSLCRRNPPGPVPSQPSTTQIEKSVAHGRKKGPDSDKMHMNRASKKLAERAVSDLVEEHNKEIGIWRHGLVVHEAPSLETFEGTQSQWYDAVKSDALSKAG